MPRDVPDCQRTAICHDALLGNRQAQAEPRTVRSALGELQEHSIDCAVRQAAAMVAHIDSHKSAVDRRSEGDFGASSRELESVVQKVHHRPENLLPIGVYVQFGVDSDYGKRAAARLGEQVGSRGRIVYQSGQ